MKHRAKHSGKHNTRILTLLALLAVLGVPAAARVSAQNIQQPATAPETQPNADPIRQLNLSPEQREQIRSIRENNRAERLAIKNHLDNANRALEETLNAESPDESVVEERLHEVAAAQASVMRMRILTEIRIRRVLTQEQRRLLQSLQQQARQERRERQLDNVEQRKERRDERSRGLNQSNGLRPALPRRRP
ncbi:MAG TPA: periplasmic heavy metal sensor [Pyrinomonadaceae bacterium]|jgi:Spy/CpxP family protein refolding chaperone|nr:periplasmic heavy metal sensor [Pyrinomonadaceae bacterium]